MVRLLCCLITLSVLACCSGPSYFNSPSDFVGGNRAVAVETHCARQAGSNDVHIFCTCHHREPIQKTILCASRDRERDQSVHLYERCGGRIDESTVQCDQRCE